MTDLTNDTEKTSLGGSELNDGLGCEAKNLGELILKINILPVKKYIVTYSEALLIRDSLQTKMVNKFLGWKLPKDFSPDCGISFDKHKYANHAFEPIGTNLFTADQAKEMIKYMLDDVQLHIEFIDSTYIKP